MQANGNVPRPLLLKCYSPNRLCGTLVVYRGLYRIWSIPIYTTGIFKSQYLVYTGIQTRKDNRMELGKAEEIAESFRAKILSGELPADTKIGSERELSEELGVSRMTVRRAIEIIEGEGLVTRYPSRGTYVAGTRERVLVDKGREIQPEAQRSSIDASELQKSGSFLKDMERIGRKPHIQFLEQPSLVAADSETARHLQLQEGTLVFKRYRLQSADNLPYRLIESYYPADLFGELLTLDIGTKPLFAWLQERHNLRVAHVQEKLFARPASQSERQLLRIAQGSPVMVIDRTVWTDSGRPVEWAHITAVAALYEFTYEYDIFEWNKELKNDNGTKPDQPNT